MRDERRNPSCSRLFSFVCSRSFVLVPKLLFGNACLPKLLFRPALKPSFHRKFHPGRRNRSFAEGRSQTGVWERETSRTPQLSSGGRATGQKTPRCQDRSRRLLEGQVR